MPTRHLIDRSFIVPPLDVVASAGHLLTLSNGQEVFDATGGAAVSCIGHGNREVKDAILKQLDVNSYCNSMLFSSPVCEELAREVIDGTGGLMRKVWFCSSGESKFCHFGDPTPVSLRRYGTPLGSRLALTC